MLDEKEYINKVWEKYNNSLDKHQNNKNIYLKSKIFLLIKNIIAFILTVCSTSGFVYAGVATYQYFQDSYKADFSNHNDFDYNYSEDMICADIDIYYKTIYNYQEYNKYQKIWNTLDNIDEQEFNNNFMIIILLEGLEMRGMHISNISTTEDTLYIELDKYSDNEVYNNENMLICSLIPLSDMRNNIIISKKSTIPYSSKYKILEDIPMDYAINDAINDGCFVLKGNKVISNDENQIYNFFDKTQNGEEDFLRVVKYYNEGIVIQDIQYKNGKYITCTDCTRHINGKKFYDISTIVKIKKNTTIGSMIWLTNENDTQVQICTIQ